MSDKPPVPEKAPEDSDERWARLASGAMALLCGAALAVFALWDAVERLITKGQAALWSVAVQDAAILVMAVLLLRIGLHVFRKARGGDRA